MMNATVSGADGSVLDGSNITEIEDPFGTKINFSKAVVVDNNGFELSPNIGKFVLVDQEKVGKNLWLDLKTGFVKSLDNNAQCFITKGVFRDQYGNNINLKDSLLKDSQENPLFANLGIIETDHGRIYDLKSGISKIKDPTSTVRLSQTYKPAHNVTGNQNVDKKGRRLDTDLGVITNKDGIIIANNIRDFYDSDGSMFDIVQMLEPKSMIPKFLHHVLEDTRRNSLNLLTGQILNDKNKEIFRDV